MPDFERGLTIVFVLVGVLLRFGYRPNAQRSGSRAESGLP
jgi:hypothetical protein